MTSRSKFIYVPSLRLKKGELDGLRALRVDVADCILPVLIVPPRKERASDSQEELFPSGEGIPDVGRILSKWWPRRPCFVDPSALLKEYGSENAEQWLPGLFTHARNLDVIAIPVVGLTDLESVGTSAFRNAISESDRLKFGLRIQSGEMADPKVNERIQAVLSNMDIAAADCAVFADFTDAELADPSLVAPVIRSSLEHLQAFGRWQLIVFQGTHYPEKNPAEPGQTFTHPRNEWKAWKEAVQFDPSTADHMPFGDFVADCAKMDFRGHGAQPIRHCRYAGQSDWLVVRGSDTGSTFDVMKDVFRRVVASAQFSGPTFSEADAYIHAVASGNSDRAGNATTWRQLNTTHHITRVVADIAKVRGIPITEMPSSPTGAQLALVEE